MEQRCNRMIGVLVIKFIVMSILTIGERSIYNYHSPYFSNNSDQLTMARRQKRIRQQQYRLELIGQMNQKYQRTKRRNQQDLAYNRKYDRVITQSPYNDYQGNASIYNRRKQSNNNLSNSLQKIRRRQPQLQQFIPSSYSYIEKPSHQLQNRFHNNYNSGNKIDQRIDVASSDKFDNIIVDLEKRRQQLNTYEDKKIEEVYERMYDSVQKLHNENYVTLPTQSEGPVRYNKNAAKSTINPEQDQPLYFSKLPPLFKSHELERQERSVEGSQKNWKQWYAKQKLRQLQSYYKKIASNEQTTRAQLFSLSRMNGQRGRNSNY